MKKLLYGALLGAAALSLGCAITDYPVITDSRGPYDNQVENAGLYDKAYIIPSGTVATIWDDGTDELYTLVAQDWKGDQWLYTYNNFDSTGAVTFLDQTYCDPTRQSNCALSTSWNPDLPNAYPHGSEGAGYNNVDDPFDYTLDTSCSGARSLCLLVGFSSRIGECGSGLWANKQSLAYEFSILDRVNFRGKSVYHLPIDSSIAEFNLTGQDGATATMPIYGRFNLYMDEKLRSMVQLSGNAKFQGRWLGHWTSTHGAATVIDMVYGSLTARFNAKIRPVQL